MDAMPWIIRINPDDKAQGFRLADSLAEAAKHKGIMALTPIRCERKLLPGDLVYLRQVGKHAGLCGIATVVEPTAARPQPEWQRRFGNPQNYDAHARRVLLRVRSYRTEPVAEYFDGSKLWRSNSGTTQKCPTKGCPKETLDKFDAVARDRFIPVPADKDADS